MKCYNITENPNKYYAFGLLALFFFCSKSSFGQKNKEFKIMTVAFYNLENIFDTINDPYKFDESSPIMETRFKRQSVYNQKIGNMAKVISEIGTTYTNNSPAILGVAEIENRQVLEDLVSDSSLIKSDYGIVHYDSPDLRGIDVALLYQKKIFRPVSSKAFELKLFDQASSKRVYTRDILLVSGLIESEMFHFLINHWPSRRGGELKSEYKRLAAASLNKKIIDSLQVKNPYCKILVMGDFNDNPSDVSIKNVLKAKGNIKNIGIKELYNPMIKMRKNGLGSNAYLDRWSLFDQIMITSSLIDKEYKGFIYFKSGIYNKTYLTYNKGRWKGYPFRSFAEGKFTGGYSDHFPVYLYLIKRINSNN